MKVFKRLFFLLPLVLMFLVSCHGKEPFYLGLSTEKPALDEQATVDVESLVHLVPIQIKQVVRDKSDYVYDIAVDVSENIYMTGWDTEDDYLIGLLVSGEDVWNLIPDAANSCLAFKSNAIYVTANVLTGSGRTILIAKYNSVKDEPDWRKEHEIGAIITVVNDLAIAEDGTIYVVGKTLRGTPPDSFGYYAFLTRFTSSGKLEKEIEIGVLGVDSSATSVAVDEGKNVYMAGQTEANLDGAGPAPHGGKDFFVAKYSSDGSQIWLKQEATAKDDYAYGIAVDEDGNTYVAGATTGVIEGGRDEDRTDRDAFIAKFASNDGKMVWKKQISTPGDDEAKAVIVDSKGNVFITGYISGKLRGEEYKGKRDIFVAGFSKDGREYIDQIGTQADDVPKAMTLDKDENIYIAGDTWGKFPGFEHRVSPDIFIIKYQTKP